MKSFKFFYGSLLLMFLVSFTAQAQSAYQKGTIQISKKKSIDAYVLIDFTKPQSFQSTITYLTPKSYAKYLKKGKIKKSNKVKLKSKEIKGFTLDDGTTFRTVKYIDLNKRGIGMLPKSLCLEQISNGKIDSYKLYSKTSGKMSYELSNAIMDSKMDGDQILIDYIQNNFQLLVQKNSKNPKNINAVNLLNYIGDNETVKANYDSNYYGFRNQFTERQKMGVFVSQKYEQAFLKMINDYNGGATLAQGSH